MGPSPRAAPPRRRRSRRPEEPCHAPHSTAAAQSAAAAPQKRAGAAAPGAGLRTALPHSWRNVEAVEAGPLTMWRLVAAVAVAPAAAAASAALSAVCLHVTEAVQVLRVVCCWCLDGTMSGYRCATPGQCSCVGTAVVRRRFPNCGPSYWQPIRLLHRLQHTPRSVRSFGMAGQGCATFLDYTR